MYNFLLVVHMLITLALIGIVMLQRSEGSGFVGTGGGFGSFMSARGAGNLLTKTTGVLATLFIINIMVLAIMAGRGGKEKSLIEDAAPAGQQEQPAPEQPAQ